MVDKNEITEKIRKYISEYDSVFVLGNGIFMSDSFLQKIPRQAAKKILLLVIEPERGSIPECGIDIQVISYEEYCNMAKLYYMYEFSDRLHMLDDNPQYGNLGNYISSGLLTEEEAFMASLGKGTADK